MDENGRKKAKIWKKNWKLQRGGLKLKPFWFRISRVEERGEHHTSLYVIFFLK